MILSKIKARFRNALNTIYYYIDNKIDSRGGGVI